MNIRYSVTLEDWDEICVHLDDLGRLIIELEILSLLGQKYYICCFELGEKYYICCFELGK